MTGGILRHRQFTRSFYSVSCHVSIVGISCTRCLRFCFRNTLVQVLTVPSNWLTGAKWNPCVENIPMGLLSTISGQDSSHATFLNKLEFYLKEHQLDEAWTLFNEFKNLHGYPELSVVRRLIIELSYSSNSRWLRKAHNLVVTTFKEKPHLLHQESLAKLALALARAQMPVPASTVIRITLEQNKFIPMDVWSLVFLHLVKTHTGACVALNLLVDICECFLNTKMKTRAVVTKSSRVSAPKIMIFTLVLNACARFGTTLKAQQVIEDLVPRMGIIADAGFIVAMSLVYEKNGLRDALKSLKEFIDTTPISLNHHYQMFYNSLLSLHFKFNDVDAAAGLILNLYRRGQAGNSCSKNVVKRREFQKPYVVHAGSSNLRTGRKLQIEPDKLENDFIIAVDGHNDLVRVVDGNFVATSKALARVINLYIADGKSSQLSNLLVGIEKGIALTEKSRISSDVIGALVQLGWLETVHDVLEDFALAGIPAEFDAYKMLLRAYYKENQLKEASVLLGQMRKAGLLNNLPDAKVISMCLSEDKNDIVESVRTRSSGLVYSLNYGAKHHSSIPSIVFEFNSSIYFFCKAAMIEDALKVFKKMQQMQLQPTVQTFNFLLNGYSSLHMYRDITVLWGEAKKRIESGNLAVDSDLLESFLLNFIRGGYFERVMEVASYLMKHSMFVDKWMYKKEFLKLHKDLYKNLKVYEGRTEAQSKRLEHVQAVRKWVGIAL